MRTSIWMSALALVAGNASAQQRADPTRSGPAADTLRVTRLQAIAASLLANPLLDIAREQTQQVRAQRVEAVAIPDPVLGASLDGQPGFLQLGSAAARNVNLGLTIPFPDKFRLRNTIGLSNIRASESQFRLAQQLVAAQAARAYDSVLVTRLHRRDLTDARQLAADFLVKTQARFDAGTVARLDVIKAQVAVAQADNDLIANVRDVANADAALNRALGRPLGLPIAPLDSLQATGPLPDLDSILVAAFRARPELATIVAQQRAASANRALIKEQAFLPDFSLSANRDFAQDAGTMYSAGLSMPLAVFFWQHLRGDFSESHHRELELAASYRDIAAGVGQDVRAAYATADAAQRQVVFIRDQLLPSAREAYRVATVSYGLGGLSALDVLDARRTLVDAQRQYADALAAANSARSDLERAAGVPLTTFAPGAPRE
jgi:cobalt-zinc-cadmium efflux system outer membrane protein